MLYIIIVWLLGLQKQKEVKLCTLLRFYFLKNCQDAFRVTSNELKKWPKLSMTHTYQFKNQHFTDLAKGLTHSLILFTVGNWQY